MQHFDPKRSSEFYGKETKHRHKLAHWKIGHKYLRIILPITHHKSTHVTTVCTIVGKILALSVRSVDYCMNTQPTLCTLYIGP